MNIRNSLSLKLFLSYLAVVVIGGVVLFSAARLSMPVAYNHHMLGATGMGGGMGPGRGMMGDAYGNFRSSFFEALAYAGVAAVITSIFVSAYFSRRIIAPLKALMMATQRISAGHFEERVQVTGSDELGQLGENFNSMTVQLEQTENRRRQLIGDVSHELRTPLTAIKGSMEGLVDGFLQPTPDLFIQIQKEADRLSRLVDDLQELSRVESGAYQLQVHPIPVSVWIAPTLKRLSPEIKRKNIQLTNSLSGELPLVLADEDRMVQVMMNLVGNAVNYTPEYGEIVIEGRAEGKFVRVAVRDNGIGISPEHLPHVFDRFYRVDKSRSRESGGGSGIGLTVTKTLVEAQGGSILAESQGEGKGSTFSFTIPISR